jgi:hypothetical protein
MAVHGHDQVINMNGMAVHGHQKQPVIGVDQMTAYEYHPNKHDDWQEPVSTTDDSGEDEVADTPARYCATPPPESDAHAVWSQVSPVVPGSPAGGPGSQPVSPHAYSPARAGYEQRPMQSPPPMQPPMPLAYSPMSPHMGPYHPQMLGVVHAPLPSYSPHGHAMPSFPPSAEHLQHPHVPPPPPPPPQAHPQDIPMHPHDGYPVIMIPGGYPGAVLPPGAPHLRQLPDRAPPNPDSRGREELRAYPDDTTLMLRNLPNKITQKRLLERMENYRMAINFLYLPTDFENKCNLGYAFMNFRDGLAAARFALEFDGSRLLGFRKSNKVLAVQPARVQGLAANVRRFRNSSVMGVLTEEEKPLLLQYGEVLPFPEPDGPLPPVGARRAPRKP